MGVAASIPPALTKAQAKEVLGPLYDEAAFDEIEELGDLLD